jgi:hypothetical protein
VSTVDEYEAQREPHRRRLKEQEKRSGNSNVGSNRTDHLRRILSISTSSASSFTKAKNYDKNDTVHGSASDYVSVQELEPKEQSRIGLSRIDETQQTPLSETANDIFEAYQQSFIGVEQEEQQITTSTRQHQSSQRHRPKSITNAGRSVSAPSLLRSGTKKSQQPHPQQQHEGRGLLRRFFHKKDLHVKIEL